jgi:integrase
MAQKLAIFEEQEQNALLGACQENDNEYIPIWLMLRCGMHPSDISKAKDKFRFNGQFLEWKRAKNSKPRREIVPKDVMPRLVKWLKKGRKLTRVGYYQLVQRVGTRVGHPEYSPMTLRHTFGLQELRKFMRQKPPPPDFIGLVAKKMGCDREVVMQNYIDLTQWENLGGTDG